MELYSIFLLYKNLTFCCSLDLFFYKFYMWNAMTKYIRWDLHMLISSNRHFFFYFFLLSFYSIHLNIILSFVGCIQICTEAELRATTREVLKLFGFHVLILLICVYLFHILELSTIIRQFNILKFIFLPVDMSKTIIALRCMQRYCMNMNTYLCGREELSYSI